MLIVKSFIKITSIQMIKKRLDVVMGIQVFGSGQFSLFGFWVGIFRNQTFLDWFGSGNVEFGLDFIYFYIT